MEMETAHCLRVCLLHAFCSDALASSVISAIKMAFNKKYSQSACVYVLLSNARQKMYFHFQNWPRQCQSARITSKRWQVLRDFVDVAPNQNPAKKKKNEKNG